MPSHEKEVEFAAAPNGITGLETALGLALRVLHREYGMLLAGVIALMTARPAGVIGLRERGTLKGWELRGLGDDRRGRGVELCGEGDAVEV
jgi:dihydroorotase-like cyclic amidohydrolase